MGLTRPACATVAAAALLLLSGCEVREMVLGVSEPDVQGVPTSNFDPADLGKLAVLVEPVVPSGQYREAGLESLIADNVEAALSARGWACAPRADLNAAIADPAHRDHFPNEADVPRLGQRMGVSAVLVVMVTEDQVSGKASAVNPGTQSWSYRLGMSARLVDVRRGDLLWSAQTSDTHHLEDPHARRSVIGPVTRGLAHAFPAHIVSIPPP